MKVKNKTNTHSTCGKEFDFNSTKKSISPSELLALEPRILFDGAAVATGVEATLETGESADFSLSPVSATNPQDIGNELSEALSQTSEPTSGRTEIVFVDTSVENYQILLEQFGANVEIILIDSTGDGVEQIASVLSDRQGIDAVHIISHGNSGTLDLGTTKLTAISIEGKHADEMAIIASAMSENGDILIYGCNFGQYTRGENAVDALATATGADVAASNDLTGAAEQGGDWDLEVQTGGIETFAISPTEWMQTLDLTINDVSAVGANGLAQAILGTGVTINSTSFSGTNDQAGTFVTGAGASFGNDILTFTDGAIFSTGTAVSAGGPNNAGGFTVNAPSGIDGDADFDALAGNNTFDASFIEISFTPDIPPGASVGDTGRMTIEIVFGSDEYNEYVYGGVNDTLAVIVNGNNQAVVPNGLSIGIDTINDAGTFNPTFGNVANDPNPEHVSAGFESAAPSLYVNNSGGAFNTQLDGFTITVPVTFDVIVGQANTIKLGIADTGDSSFDSWMFVKGDSGQTVIVAENDNVTTPTDTPLTLDVTDNDYDLQGDALTVTHILDQPVVPGDVVTLASGVTVTVEANGDLTVSGDGTNTALDTFTYQISDGNGGSSIAFVSVNITAANTAPTLDLNDDGTTPSRDFTTTFTEDGSAVSVADTDMSISDDSQISGATISLTNAQISDQLNVPGALPAGISVDGASTATNIILTGDASAADYETAIKAITFANSSDDPVDNVVRNINIQLTDSGGLSSNVAATSISVLSVNDEPSGSDATLSTAEDTPFTFSAVDFGFSDASEGDNFQSVTVQPPANGSLAFNGVPVNAATVIPVGSIGLLVYTPVSDANGNGIDTISFQVTDDGGTANTGQNTDQSANTITFNVTAVNDAPTLDSDGNDSAGVGAGGYDTTFTENTAAIGIVDSDVDIADVDSDLITEATITLTNGQIGDVLNIGGMPAGLAAIALPNPPGPLAATGTIVVTIIGNGTTADYETALQAITFQTNGENPDTTDRVLNIQVSENSDSSNTTTTTIHITAVNDNPVLDLDGDNSSGVNSGNFATTYTENGLALAVADVDTIIQDLDDSNIESATITLTNGQIGDLLSIGALPVGISLVGVAPTALAAAGSVTVQLTGSASMADYQTALAAIGFSSTSENPDTTQRAITVVVNDGDANSNTSTNFVTVISVNDPPVIIDPLNPLVPPADPDNIIPDVASDDGEAVPALDTSIYFSDVENDPLTFTATGLPVGLTVHPVTGIISGTIDPSASQAGNDPVNAPGVYTAVITGDDGNGGVVTTTVTYTISNPAPIAADDVATGDEDNAIAGNVISDAGGVDVDGGSDSDTLNVSEVSGDDAVVGQPVAGSAGGLFTINADGSYSFDPNGEFEGLAAGDTRDTTIEYQVSDGQGGYDTATLTVTVTGVNDAPVAAGPVIQQSVDDGETIAPVDASTSFNNPNGDVLTYSADNLPAGLTIDPATGIISGTVDGDASLTGTYVTLITATTPTGDTATSSVVWNVANVDPDATDDNAATALDTPVTINPLSNDVDGGNDDDTLSVASVTAPANGSVVVNPDGTVTYTPNLGFSGTDTFDYTVDDGQGGTDTATITIAVDVPLVGAPTATPIAPANLDDGETIAPIDTSVSFTDPDGDPLTFTAINLPDGLTMDPATGIITGIVDNDASEDGPYSVQVTATDPSGNQVTETLTIGVANPAPTAGDDSADTAINTPVTVNVLGNDTDPDGDTLSVALINDQPTNGTVTINPDGTIDYTPNAAFVGADTFTYILEDANGGRSEATVTINVGIVGPNTPTATPIAPQTVTEGAPIVPIDVSGSFVDPDGDPLTFTAIGLPEGLTIDPATGIISGTPDNDASLTGPYTVSVTAVDPSGNQVSEDIVIGVDNPAPTANPDNATTTPDNPVVISVLTNDTDPDGDTLSVSATTAPANGVVVVNPDGTVTYTPNLGFEGTDTFTYTVSDGQGGTDTQTVTVEVTDTPTGVGSNSAVPDQTSDDGQTIAPVDTSQYLVDPDGDPLTFTATGLPVGLTVHPVTGVISGTIDPSASQGGNDPVNAPGVYTAAITGDDGNGGVVTTTVTYTISNVDPIVTGALPDLEQHDADDISIDAASVFDDPDGDALTFTATGLPIGLSIDPVTGEINGTIDDVASNSGPYTITVFADDGEGGVVRVTFEMEVLANGLPLPPKSEVGQGPETPPNGQGSSGDDNDDSQTIVTGVLSDAIEDMESLNGGPNVGPGQDSFITELVAWIGEQGKGWMDNLLSSDGYGAYVGQSLDLDVTFDGAGENASLRIRTLVVDGVVFVELSSIGGRSTLLSQLTVLGAEGSVVPQTVLRIDERSLAINQIVGKEQLSLRLKAAFEGGVSEFWDIKINMILGEVMAENHGGGGQTFNGFNEQIQRFAAANDVANKQLIDAL